MSELEVELVQIDLKDGTYMIEAILEGGSGRASITSPTELMVDNHSAKVSIEWSSANYDYMVLEGKTYYPVNENGNSVFELPVISFDEQIEIVADTTAMSVPHEITYTILLDSESIKNSSEAFSTKGKSLLIIGIVVVMLVAIGVALVAKRKRKRNI